MPFDFSTTVNGFYRMASDISSCMRTHERTAAHHHVRIHTHTPPPVKWNLEKYGSIVAKKVQSAYVSSEIISQMERINRRTIELCAWTICWFIDLSLFPYHPPSTSTHHIRTYSMWNRKNFSFLHSYHRRKIWIWNWVRASPLRNHFNIHIDDNRWNEEKQMLFLVDVVECAGERFESALQITAK